MEKEDVASIVGPIVGLATFAAVNIAAVKIVEYRRNKAAKKAIQTAQEITSK
jgi:hypothetical protein